jgi:alpha-galactosidase
VRTIAELLGICRDIRELARPGALLINYSNPMAMNTWACNRHGGVRTLGLCHGVQEAHRQIADCITHWARREGLLGAEEKAPVGDVHVIASGINHQTWFVHAEWRGIDFIPKMLEIFEGHPTYPRTEKVRIDVLRRFGYYSTESNGHLSEYLPWYRKHTDRIAKWIDLGYWIHGETGGYLRECLENRDWFKHAFPQWLAEPPVDLASRARTHEHAGWIIEALETGRAYRGHFNTQNRGNIPNLPDDAVVEIPGYVDKTGIHFPVLPELPLACAATCSASIRVQQMGMEAAVRGDVTLLKQAMLHDPLVGAVCEPEEVWQMTDEMLVAQARWLPQYAGEIAAAKERLAAHERNGTRVKLRETQGAARQKPRSVDELARDKK